MQKEFEKWINNPHMLNKRNEPGYVYEYEHPYTNGAWKAWQECYKRFVKEKTGNIHSCDDPLCIVCGYPT